MQDLISRLEIMFDLYFALDFPVWELSWPRYAASRTNAVEDMHGPSPGPGLRALLYIGPGGRASDRLGSKTGISNMICLKHHFQSARRLSVAKLNGRDQVAVSAASPGLNS